MAHSSQISLVFIALQFMTVFSFAGEFFETNLHGDTPDLHIIAIDKNGDLNFPAITRDGKALTEWSPEAYEVELSKLDTGIKPDTDPTQMETKGTNGTVDAYLGKMMKAIKDRQAKSGKKLKIVIHIHGGMNSITGSVQAAAHGYWVMQQQDPDVYPIFVCWNSEPLSCYWDHLRFDRSGYSLNDSNWEAEGYLTAPLVLAGDLGAGIAHGPQIAAQQAMNDFKTVRPQLYPEHVNYVPMFEEKKAAIVRETEVRKGTKGQAIHVMQGANKFSDTDGFVNACKYTITSPFKLLTGGLINGLGPGAWAEMKRRVDLMFWKQEQLLPYYRRDTRNLAPVGDLIEVARENRLNTGGMIWFLSRLKSQVLLGQSAEQSKKGQAKIKIKPEVLKARIDSLINETLQNGNSISGEQFDALKAGMVAACSQGSNLSGLDTNFEIDLFGHSMGSIVINEMLKSEPDIAYQKIVYMAAACSVKDFQGAVIPYLEQHPESKFYNLCLNPEAELRNIEMLELLPRGGLLSWINDIFEQPADIRHRTYGQFITSINTSDLIPPAIRGRVYMKAYGFGTHPEIDDTTVADPHFQEGFPHNHGEFRSFGSSTEFFGNRPASANPHGFWTEDFTWYNPKSDPARKVNPLTLKDKKDPDTEPGSPVYLNAFDESWQKVDQCPSQFYTSDIPHKNQGTKHPTR